MDTDGFEVPKTTILSEIVLNGKLETNVNNIEEIDQMLEEQINANLLNKNKSKIKKKKRHYNFALKYNLNSK